MRPDLKVAALDVGKVRVGVAVSDDLGLCAHPRPPLDARNRKALLGAIVQLARDEAISRFLIGMPIELSGEHGPAARRAVAFAQSVADATGLEVEMRDERLTSHEAERRLSEAGHATRKSMRPHVDGAAAAVILQAWLDAKAGPQTD